MHDGTQTADSGPAWRDFVEPQPQPEPEPPPPEPPPPPPPPEPVPRQVVIGKPKRELPIAAVIMAILGLGVLGGGGYGILYAAQNVDFSSLPLISSDKKAASASGPKILVSLTSTCKDTKGQDCNLVWDVTSVEKSATGLRVSYDLRATGQAGCSVAIEADKALAARLEQAGRPGPFVEGARGRYYPLIASEGLTQAGGPLACDSKQNGAWTFAPSTGESFVKLRYPGLPPARIELDPVSAQSLPADDPLAVIPVQQSTCQTVQKQQCNGTWEIGPYGSGADGTPIVFFAMRFDGPATNCQINWSNDLDANKALQGQGDKGIRLELTGGTGDLTLVSSGGISAQNGPLNCNTVFAGFWRFAAGNLTQTVNLKYPDFPDVQIPIKP